MLSQVNPADFEELMPSAVLVAEDDRIHRNFICDALRNSHVACAKIFEASDGERAVQLAIAHQPVCAVLDLQMPNLSGVETARRMWQNNSQIRILFWSNFADVAYVRSLARIVPDDASYGYLLKSSRQDLFIAAAEGVFLRGQCIVDREIRNIQSRFESNVDRLTDVEYDMLVDIAHGLTDHAISVRHGLSTRGVQSRTQKLYEKLVGNDHTVPVSTEPAIYNPRTRSVFVALLKGLINVDLMARLGDDEDGGGSKAR